MGAPLTTRLKRCSNCLAEVLGTRIFMGGNSEWLTDCGIGWVAGFSLAIVANFNSSLILLWVVVSIGGLIDLHADSARIIPITKYCFICFPQLPLFFV